MKNTCSRWAGAGLIGGEVGERHEKYIGQTKEDFDFSIMPAEHSVNSITEVLLLSLRDADFGSGRALRGCGNQYWGIIRLKPSIMAKCRRLRVTSVRPSSIAIAATSESKTWSP
jgi:hypothetical protein